MDNKIGKFVIINLDTMEYFKNEGNTSIVLFNDMDSATEAAWIYELENVHILETKNYYND